MAKFKALHTVDEFSIPNLVIKVKPYIYGNKRSLADPNCDIRIHADLWVTTGDWKTTWSTKPKMEFHARARIDFDKMEFHDPKTCKRIEVSNAEEVIEAIRMAMEREDDDVQ